MPIPVEDLVARMEWAAGHGLSELTVVAHSSLVTILRQGAADSAGHPPASPSRDTPEAGTPDPVPDAVTAPLAGLCHLAPEAGSAPFVMVGQAVGPGLTLCMIEAMKVMTAVPAPHGGTVEAILIEDGASVEAGTPLVRLSR